MAAFDATLERLTAFTQGEGLANVPVKRREDAFCFGCLDWSTAATLPLGGADTGAHANNSGLKRHHSEARQ